jgi:hypothetical protein
MCDCGNPSWACRCGPPDPPFRVLQAAVRSFAVRRDCTCARSPTAPLDAGFYLQCPVHGQPRGLVEPDDLPDEPVANGRVPIFIPNAIFEVQCHRCGGTGRVQFLSRTPVTRCSTCGGTGRVTRPARPAGAACQHNEDLPDCSLVERPTNPRERMCVVCGGSTSWTVPAADDGVIADPHACTCLGQGLHEVSSACPLHGCTCQAGRIGRMGADPECPTHGIVSRLQPARRSAIRS